MGTSAWIEFCLKRHKYGCFYHKDGYADSMGLELHVFLRKLSSSQCKELEKKLREEVSWYVDFAFACSVLLNSTAGYKNTTK